ncbi:MAG: hypothetical protein ACRDYU_03720 [Actinomycetes bacterium]
MATTTERGYGWDHQRQRQAALAELGVTGVAPCPICGEAMTLDMHLDYDHVIPLALGGRGPKRLTHRSCNRRRGQALGQKLRRRRVIASRQW